MNKVNKKQKIMTILFIAVLSGIAVLMYLDIARPVEAPNVIETQKQSVVTPTPEPTPEITESEPQLAQAVLGAYTFNFPKDWTKDEKPTTISFKSPDYKLAEGYPVLEKGVEIIVSAKPTTSTDIRTEINKNVMLTRVAQNMEETKIGTLPAMQYNYDFEGTIASSTDFIKDGTLYSIKYRYANDTDKAKYSDVYKLVLSDVASASQ